MYIVNINKDQYTVEELKQQLRELQELAINHKSIRTQKWLLNRAVKLRFAIELLENGYTFANRRD